MKINTKKLIYISVFTALTAALTMFPQIPWGMGYIHAGDSVIFLCSIMFGSLGGAFCGAVGSSIADVFTYPIFAPSTFIIKGIMGLVVGIIARGGKSKIRLLLSFLCGALIVIIGYFIAEFFLFGSIEISYMSVISSMCQEGISILLSLALLKIVKLIGRDLY